MFPVIMPMLNFSWKKVTKVSSGEDTSKTFKSVWGCQNSARVQQLN